MMESRVERKKDATLRKKTIKQAGKDGMKKEQIKIMMKDLNRGKMERKKKCGGTGGERRGWGKVR